MNDFILYILDLQKACLHNLLELNANLVKYYEPVEEEKSNVLEFKKNPHQ